MKKLVSFSLAVCLISPKAYAQTCQQFTNKGMRANSLVELVASPASKAQVNDFKEVIGDHVSDIAGSWFSSKKKAFNLVRENGQLVMFVRDSLAMTRGDCFVNPARSMEQSAKDNFDMLLDSVIKKHDL